MNKYQVEDKYFDVKIEDEDTFKQEYPKAALVGETSAFETLKQQHARVEAISRKTLMKTISNASGLPKWSLPYIMNVTGGTSNIIGEGVEFLESAYENVIGMSREEQIADGKNPLSVALEKFYDYSNAFDTKYYSKAGDVLDFDDLIRNKEYSKAAQIASEGAAESAPSILMSIANPLVGGAIMGISTAGGQFKDDLVNRPDQTLNAVMSNALWAGGSEMLTEWVGGKAFRGINGMVSGGAALSAVNDFTSNYVLKLVGKTLGSGVAESVTEGLNSAIQDSGDMLIYGDEVTTKEFVKNIVNSVGPAFILGGLGGGAGSIRPRDNQDLYKFVAPRKWKQEYLNIGKNITEANKDLDAAPDSKKKFFENRINDLVDKRTEHESSLFDVFENLSNTELKKYAENIDKSNKNTEIIGNNKYSESSQKAAEQKNLEYIQNNLNILGKEYSDIDIETEKILGEALKSSETISERLNKLKGINKQDLDVKVLKTEQDISDAVSNAGKGVKNSDGAFIAPGKDGKATIYINQNVAEIAGATNVVGHELLHYMMSRKFKTDNKSMKPLVDELKTYLQKNNPEVYSRVQARIDEHYTDDKGEVKEGALEEYLNVFSDLMSKQKLDLKDAESKGIMSGVKDVMAGFGFGSIKLDSAKDVVSFLSTYNKNINRKGLLGKLMGTKILDVNLTSTKLVKGKTDNVDKKSRSSLIETINNLQQGATTKADFQNPETFNKVFESVQPNGAVSNYIKSLQMSPEKTQETIDSVTDRLINFDPAAKRKDGTVIGPKGLGEFIMANVGFGKLDAAKKLFKKGEKAKRETSIDTEEAKELTNESTETKKQEPKGQKARVLKSLADININNKEVVSSTARAEINSLIEQNPKNLEQSIKNIIDKEITKAVKAQMGKISNVKGEVVISEEYKAFIALNYENIVKSLDVTTIKNNYKTLFELTEIGKEDRKTKKSDKPSLKKDSNYRKGIFKIETNKAKFTKFFTEGGYTTLLARQKGLANQIAKGIVENVVNNEIIENSNNNDAIINVKLKDYASKLNKQKNEVQGNYNDIVKFSKTAARKAINDGMFLADLIVKNKGVKGIYETGVYPPRLINNPRRITIEMQEFIFNEIYADGNLTQLTSKELKGIQTAKILQKAGRIYANTNNGAIYEQFIIDVASQIPGIQVLSATMAEGGIPDLHVMMHGKDFFVEVKMANAQYSSITISDYDISKNKWTIKKKYDFNPQIDALVQKASKGVKAAQKFVNDAKIPDPVTKKPFVWKKFGDPIPTQAIQMLKDAGLYKGMMAVDNDFNIENIGEMYRGKEYPVYYIHIQGKGLFHMGVNPLKLPVPKLTGTASLTLRRVPSTKYKQVSGVKTKTGYTTLTYRAIPIIDAASVTKSDFSIGNNLEFNELMQTKEVKFLEAQQEAKSKAMFSKSINKSRVVNEPKGITVLDFDDTLATSKSLIKYTQPDGTKGTLTPEQYASTYQDLQDLGYKFDFSEFNKVVDGKVAPLFQKALKLQGKFGPENMFVLTARPEESAPAIFAFIKANGLNIPLKNITGLANSTSEAKALWIADKVGEGYNDFYFADDALQNVQAVDNMLNQFDVKRKVQQAKVKFSESMDENFNDIIQDVTGIESQKRFDFIKARKRGADKGKFRYFIPPSHEDFVGLLYNFMGKGEKGNAHRDFLEEALVRPLNRANKEYDTARQSIATDYKNLNNQFPEVKQKLINKTPDGDFTYQDAVRIYLWDKHGHNIPGLSPIDQANLVELVKTDNALQSYADAINTISKQETYVNPTEGWNSGDIRMDLDDATGRVGRAQFFEEFQENSDIIFSTENLNKIEAGFGKGVKEALEDILYRVKTGRNRPSGQNELVNKFMNYLNGSVGSVMFFNMRSALLQQMSIVNYINFAQNNIFAAAKAFANQPQYWKDFAFIFNSDMLKQRRGGIQTDVNGAELAASMRSSKNPSRFLISKLLEIGFLPTQIGDNIAIATGGATYYRNTINSYIKQGLSKKEAETKAFTDFQDITQSTQQSARPDMVSQQQASVLGKVILNFQNVTSQFNRLGKKAFLDIKNRRISKPNKTQMQSDISNASRITYYFAVQNAIFYTLQTALFAMMFGDDKDDENKLFIKKKERLINGSIDSVLRGSGVLGGVIATLKNVAIAFARQRDVGYNPDESAVVLEALNLSPVVGIKARKIVNAEKTLNYNKKVIDEMNTFDIDNPQWSAVTNYVEAATNLPLNRLYNKTQNVRQGFNSDHANWERTLLFLGWSQYNLNLTNEKMDKIKESTKSKNKSKTKVKGLKRTIKKRTIKKRK